MHLTSRGYLSIAELIIYVPCAILGFIVCLRHGFKRSSGWLFTVILPVLRIGGSVCQLLTYSKPSEGLIKATLILDSIGIAPLLLIVLGVLTRFVEWINASETSTKINPKLFRIIQGLIILGVILGIVGITGGGSQSSNGSFAPSTSSKAGILLYIAIFAIITIIFAKMLSKVSALPRQERPLLIHMPLALLAIAIRLVYGTLCIFVNNSTFSLFNGSITADVVMAVAEEVFVVIITIVLGFILPRVDPMVQGGISNENQLGAYQSQQLIQPGNGGYMKPYEAGNETGSSS